MQNKLSYHRLEAATTPRLINKATNEQRFWKKYLTSELIASNSAANSICANANENNLMLFAHGRTVSILDTATKQIIRKIENYTFPVTAVTVRRDGLVMATGDEEGRIEVKDTKEKFSLRTFDNHKKRINCLDYHGHDLYSAGQDMVLRLFDVASGSVVHSYENAHSDYIKCIKGLENNHLLSAGYDGTIKLFDFRVHELPQLEFNHGTQVEWFDLFPSNMNFVACGDKKITSWDIRSAKPVFENFSSKKTLTCVRVLSNGSRIMSSSFDSYLKVYKSENCEVTYQQKMESPILCFDVSRNNQFIGIGLENKKIVFKSRAHTKDEDAEEQDKQIEDEIAAWLKNNEAKGKFALNDKYFYRGIYEKPQSFDLQFQRKESKKMSEYDKYLKKFQYKRAVLLSIQKKNMTVFLALIDQYEQRGCLERVFKSLTDLQRPEVLKFLSRLVHDVRYCEVGAQLIEKVLGMFRQKLEHRGEVEATTWTALNYEIQQEIEVILNLSPLSGMLDLIEKNCNVN